MSRHTSAHSTNLEGEDSLVWYYLLMLKVSPRYVYSAVGAAAAILAGLYLLSLQGVGSVTYLREQHELAATSTVRTRAETAPEQLAVPAWPLPLDTKEYDKRLLVLSNYIPPKPVVATSTKATSTASSTVASTTPHTPLSSLVYSSTTNVTIPGKGWPTAMPYPNGGAILPFKRILAYYGNFYSRQMGVLGEYEPAEMLRRLASTTALWEAADPSTPVLPAIEYIAQVAQGSAGADGMYRATMPNKEIDKAYDLAKQVNGIMILDLQVGLSTIERELPKFKEYLVRSDVHLAIDPEFSMKDGQKPGTVIGTFDATDVNYVIDYLSTIVRDNKLPPKVLLVHRFTENMVTGSSRIKATPEVQVVMIMDGWGSKDLKRGTYNTIITPEPVQFAGIKLFYKNDLKPPSTGMLTPQEVLSLHPKPIYIQYQ